MSSTTQYQSDIVLGRQYRHVQLDITGYAEAITFYANSCERVLLLYKHDGEQKDIICDAVNLVDVETEKRVKNAREAKPGGPDRGSMQRPTAGRR